MGMAYHLKGGRAHASWCLLACERHEFNLAAASADRSWRGVSVRAATVLSLSGHDRQEHRVGIVDGKHARAGLPKHGVFVEQPSRIMGENARVVGLKRRPCSPHYAHHSTLRPAVPLEL